MLVRGGGTEGPEAPGEPVPVPAPVYALKGGLVQAQEAWVPRMSKTHRGTGKQQPECVLRAAGGAPGVAGRGPPLCGPHTQGRRA
eukprot:scaffold303099_cov17-Tisochrysis_lutea.AAC.2